MRIVVVGATGTIGSQIATEALERGHHVKAAVRDPARIERSDPRLEIEALDARSAADLARVASGRDCLVSAVGGARDGNPGLVIEVAHALIDALPAAGVRRLVVVGGAGSLMTAAGHQLVDDPDFPEAWRPSALAHREALAVYRSLAGELDWTFVSPAHEIDPGERTGRYRVGGDHLLVDDKGHSRVSVEDYGVAVVDEIERGEHPKQRISIAY